MGAEFRLFPEQASTMAPRIEALFWFVTGVAIFFTLLLGRLRCCHSFTSSLISGIEKPRSRERLMKRSVWTSDSP